MGQSQNVPARLHASARWRADSYREVGRNHDDAMRGLQTEGGVFPGEMTGHTSHHESCFGAHGGESSGSPAKPKEISAFYSST